MRETNILIVFYYYFHLLEFIGMVVEFSSLRQDLGTCPAFRRV